MSEWTNSARAKLEEYFGRVRQTLEASGADAGEVIDDLRRHIEQEIAAGKLQIVTEEDVARILAKIGAPEAGLLSAKANRPAAVEDDKPRREKKIPNVFWLVPGVLIPLVTIGFEFMTGGCAGLFFDPMPTVGHIVLMTLVPVVNLLVWLAIRRKQFQRRRVLAMASGVVLGVSLIYALLFLPLTPFAFIGIIFFGFGLIPLGPLFSFIAAMRLRVLLRRSDDGSALPGLGWGMVAGVAGLLLFSLPTILTQVGLQMAVSESVAEADKGVNLLRNWGQQELMLRSCYGRMRGESGWYNWGKYINPETARGIYYRVTGRAFNAVPPPKLYAGRGRWNAMEEEFTWDNDQGGDAVAGRVKGLTLINSRQDGIVDADGALAYLEWTLEFKNDSPLQREARAQIALPPGGVVSRLTLWIDGEEREAAFGGRSQVKTAYKAVVTQRRDPVLVTTCGPDRVLLQCFPVPPGGGKMKVRVGITTPLVLNTAERAAFRWPVFLERNFSLREDFGHSLWLESNQPLETRFYKLTGDHSTNGAFALRGKVTDNELAAAENIVMARRSPDVREIWTADTRGTDGQFVRERVIEQPVTRPDRVVLVVDCSADMKQFLPEIGEALSQMEAGLSFEVLLAQDGSKGIFGALQKSSAETCQRAANKLRFNTTAIGGHDNVPALLQAWDIAAQGEAGVIVWIHGPQPMLFDNAEELRQRFERRPGHPRLLEIQTQPGPNRIAEQLDGLKPVAALLRQGELRDDLQQLFTGWSAQGKTFVLLRERAQEPAAPAARGKETSLHLARLWAADEINRRAAVRDTAEAMRLAGLYQLVTPVSGAVVLETQQQYQQAGLNPVSADTVPVVPEPSTWLLMILGLVVFVCARRRRPALQA